MTREVRQRALARVAEEVRAEQAPELDWNGLLHRLEARLAEEPVPAAAKSLRKRSRWQGLKWSVPALVAAAAAAVFVANPPKAADPVAARKEVSPQAPPSADPGTVDGETLTGTANLVAHDAPVRVIHGDRVRWILEPGSLAHLRRNAEARTIVLERGSVSVSVVPNRGVEFGVEAAGTRVEVHGTRFRVSLSDDGVRVSVSRGVVSVAPIGQEGRRLLRAPASETFSLAASEAPSSRPRPKKMAHSTSGAPSSSEPAESAAPGPIGDESIPPVDFDTVSSIISRCFEDRTEQRGDIHVTATTTLKLGIQPNGAITEAVFDPPLAPMVAVCAEENLGKVRLSPSPAGKIVQRELLLER